MRTLTEIQKLISEAERDGGLVRVSNDEFNRYYRRGCNNAPKQEVFGMSKNWIDEALEGLPEELKQFVTVDKSADGKRMIHIAVQDDVVSKIGVVGMQVAEMIEIPRCLISFLDKKYPCKENKITMGALYLALQSDKHRTIDRENRKVEGQNRL